MSKNSSKPIRQFCFQKEAQSNNESVLFAGNAICTHSNSLCSYSISEASKEVKQGNPIEFPVNDVSIESIFEIRNDIFLLLLKSSSSSIICEVTYKPNQSILIKNSSFEDKGIKDITFCFPMPSEISNSYHTIFSANNKLYRCKLFNNKNESEEIKLPTSTRSLSAGTYVDTKTLALGVDSNLLLYDIREGKSINEGPMHRSGISTISVNRLDTNILYTGGFDGFVKQIDIRNWSDTKKLRYIYDVYTGDPSFPQCPVVHVAPNPVDKNVFATASAGNALKGYIQIFKNGKSKYSTFNPHQKSNSNDFVTATTQNIVTWIDWSPTDPSLLVSVDMGGQFGTHYFTDLDFDGILSNL